MSSLEPDVIALHREIWKLKQFLGSAVRNAGGELILDRSDEFLNPVEELEITFTPDRKIVITEVQTVDHE